MAVEFDRTILGQEFDRTTFDPVTKEKILEFAAALGETNPLYTDEAAGGLIAPPTFCTTFRGRRMAPPNMPSFGMMGFDAGRDIEFYAPIRPGDAITSTSVIYDMYEKTGRSGRMTFIVLRSTLTNQRGERVAIIDHRVMLR